MPPPPPLQTVPQATPAYRRPSCQVWGMYVCLCLWVRVSHVLFFTVPTLYTTPPPPDGGGGVVRLHHLRDEDPKAIQRVIHPALAPPRQPLPRPPPPPHPL